MASLVAIDSLPNEILLSVLATFQTPALLPLASVSRRFHALTVRVLQHRLAQAAALPDHRLILECYHPSAKLSTPYLHCEHLGTDELEDEEEPSLAALKGLYSHFRLVQQENNRPPRLRYSTRSFTTQPAQQQQQQQGQAAQTEQQPTASQEVVAQAEEEPELPCQDVYLDEEELFTQLCTVTNLGRVGPREGQFRSYVNLGNGVVRVWRRWLAERARMTASAGPVATAAAARRALRRPSEDSDGAVLWADLTKNVGLRFRVFEVLPKSQWRPVLAEIEDELPVAYRLEFEELVVRTSHLLLTVERSAEQEVEHSGTAVMII